MNRTQILAVLRRLATPPCAPYDELETRNVLHALLAEQGLHFQADPFGNTVVRVRRGLPRNKVAFVAHLDHPALRVLSKKGNQVTCQAEGALPALGIKNAKVVFASANGAVAGKITSAKVVKNDGRARIDQAVVQLVRKGEEPEIGDFAVLDLPPFAQKGSRLKLRAADDLAGVTAVLCALSELARRETACEVWGLFTRAEEVGFHGTIALVLGGLVPRDLTVVSVECSAANDTIAVGKGPVVRLGDRTGPFDPRAVALVTGAAQRLTAEEKLSFQSAMMSGGTCEATAFSAFGYRAAGIALPLSAYHNQGPRGVAPEEIDVKDLESAISLIAAVGERAGAGVDDLDLLRNELVRGSEDGRQRLRTPVVGSTHLLPEPV